MGLRTTLVVAVVLGRSTLALAEAPKSTDIVIGASSDDLRAAIAQGATSAARAGGWQVSVVEAAASESCLTAAETCASVGGNGATVMVLRLDAGGFLEARLILRTDESDLTTARRFCKDCSDAREVQALATEIVDAVIAAIARRSAPTTGLRVVAEPATALVSLGSVSLGPAGQVYQVSPGPHEVRVSAPGYVAVTRRIVVKPDETFVLEVELSEQPDDRSLVTRFGPYALMGVGVGLVGLGAVSIAIHQDAIVDGERQPTERNSRTAGIITGSIGLAAVAGAVAWWVLSPGADSEAPAVSIRGEREGVSLWWVGSF